ICDDAGAAEGGGCCYFQPPRATPFILLRLAIRAVFSTYSGTKFGPFTSSLSSRRVKCYTNEGLRDTTTISHPLRDTLLLKGVCETEPQVRDSSLFCGFSLRSTYDILI